MITNRDFYGLLEEKIISDLKVEISFIRRDSNNISEIIKNLLCITKQNMHDETKHTSNRNSIYSVHHRDDRNSFFIP